MKLLYIINGLGFSNNTGIGGADKRAIEIARNANTNPQNAFDILTTSTGYSLFTNTENLNTNYYTIHQPNWWPQNLKKHLLGRMASYIYATFISFTFTSTLRSYDIYFPSSDFFFDLLPAIVFKTANHKKLACIIHHHIQNPFKRKGPLVVNVTLYFLQKFSVFLMNQFADAIFLYATPEGHFVQHQLLANYKGKVFFIKNGINADAIDIVPQQQKIYDACFVGGLRPSKGIFEFTKIWGKVVEKMPDAKFAIVGGGSQEIVDKLKYDITTAKLEKNITLTGPLATQELYKVLKQSKLFVFPSYEEGWGIAVCEAMYCGLPIVCYDLPAFEVFGEDLNKVAIGDWKCIVSSVLNLLEYSNFIKETESRLIANAKRFTWKNIAAQEMSHLHRL